MRKIQLTPEALQAAERIARRKKVPVEKVVAAYQKAARGAKVNATSLFLD